MSQAKQWLNSVLFDTANAVSLINTERSPRYNIDLNSYASGETADKKDPHIKLDSLILKRTSEESHSSFLNMLTPQTVILFWPFAIDMN